MTREELKQQKIKILEESYKNFPWDDNLDKCFDKGSKDFELMWGIIEYARSLNRGIKADSPYFNVHHIVPRSFYKKNSIPVDNRPENLVKLTLQEHFMVHYYAWKCSKKEVRAMMAAAFHLMVGRATKGLNNAPHYSVEELSWLMIPELKQKDKKKKIKETIKNLESKFGDLNFQPIDDTHVRFTCPKCGKVEEKTLGRLLKMDKCLCRHCLTTDELFQEKRRLSHLKNLELQNKKVYPNEGTIAVVCISEDGKAFWKLLSYRFPMPYVPESYIYERIKQNDMYSDNRLLKVYDNKYSKEELQEFFKKKFGEKRSWDYYRNIYSKECFILDPDNNFIKKEDVGEKEWCNKFLNLCRKDKGYIKIPKKHLHWAYTQMCKDKDFIKRFEDALNMMYEINGGKDVKDFK